jgi:cytochrome c553
MRAVFFTLGVMILVNTAQAAGDPVAGAMTSKRCASCHGPTGISTTPTYPNLAGQHEDYIIQALHDYKSGKRVNAIMQGMASGLSDKDIEDLAAYFSLQKGLVTPTIDDEGFELDAP